MPLILDLPGNEVAESTGTHSLQGSECLVFYLGGTPNPGTSVQPPIHNILELGDAPVRAAPSLIDIGRVVAGAYSSGLSVVIIGPAPYPGYAGVFWQLTRRVRDPRVYGLAAEKGKALLVGLLLPAVQQIREAAARKLDPPSEVAALKKHTGGANLFVTGQRNELIPLG